MRKIKIIYLFSINILIYYFSDENILCLYKIFLVILCCFYKINVFISIMRLNSPMKIIFDSCYTFDTPVGFFLITMCHLVRNLVLKIRHLFLSVFLKIMKKLIFMKLIHFTFYHFRNLYYSKKL